MTSFNDWAEDRGLTYEERDIVLDAVEEEGQDPDDLSTEDLDEIAEDVGVIVGFVKSVIGWFGQWF